MLPFFTTNLLVIYFPIYFYGRKETERYGHRDVPMQCALLDV